jgi:hypothetical protein
MLDFIIQGRQEREYRQCDVEIQMIFEFCVSWIQTGHKCVSYLLGHISKTRTIYDNQKELDSLKDAYSFRDDSRDS